MLVHADKIHSFFAMSWYQLGTFDLSHCRQPLLPQDLSHSVGRDVDVQLVGQVSLCINRIFELAVGDAPNDYAPR
jgi:hypothetical protein